MPDKNVPFKTFPKAPSVVDASICDRVLVYNYDFFNSDSTSKLDFLMTIDKESYQEGRIRGELASSAYGGYFSGDDSFETFNSKRDHYLEQQHYSSDQATRISHVRKYIPPEAYQAYSTCIVNLAANQHAGLYNTVDKETETVAEVTFYWYPPAGVHTDTVTSSTLVGGTVAGRSKTKGEIFKVGTQIETNGQLAVVIKRDSPTTTIYAAVNMGGYSTVVCSDPKPVIPPRSIVNDMTSGNPFQLVLDKLTAPIGSIVPGATYKLDFSQSRCTWTATGPHRENDGRIGYGSAAYGFGPDSPGNLTRCYVPKDYELIVWGHNFAFNNNGEVSDSDSFDANHIVGHLTQVGD